MDHFISVLISLVVMFIPSPMWLSLTLPVGFTSLILNLIPVIILRYNIPRLQTLLKFAQRKTNMSK